MAMRWMKHSICLWLKRKLRSSGDWLGPLANGHAPPMQATLPLSSFSRGLIELDGLASDSRGLRA